MDIPQCISLFLYWWHSFAFKSFCFSFFIATKIAATISLGFIIRHQCFCLCRFSKLKLFGQKVCVFRMFIAIAQPPNFRLLPGPQVPAITCENAPFLTSSSAPNAIHLIFDDMGEKCLFNCVLVSTLDSCEAEHLFPFIGQLGFIFYKLPIYSFCPFFFQFFFIFQIRGVLLLVRYSSPLLYEMPMFS